MRLRRHRRLLLPVADFDRALFTRVARAHTPWLDGVMPAATRAANYSRLWLVVAAALALAGGRRGQRAALRGLGSIALTSPVVNLAIKPQVRRARPSLRHVPAARRLRAQPLTTSFPSGHAASAAAFTAGSVSELPQITAPLGALAATVAYSRIYVGVHYPLDVATGVAIGAGIGLLTRLQWPVLPSQAGRTPASPHAVRAHASADGEGVTVVVNRSSGPAAIADPAAQVRSWLPRARVVDLDGGRDLADALNEAARGAEVLGVFGGDGSVGTAAEVAVAHARPLLVLPGGTLNHLARDLRIERPEQALEALARGEAVRADMAEIDGRPFVNTASFGAYTDMVEMRERLESRIGRWPAHLLAVARTVLSSSPIELELDGRRRRLWMVFIGNCAHEPAGFGPSWRPRVDDSTLDVRLLSGEVPLARVRLLLSILSGRLTRSAAYERRLVDAVHVAARWPLRLARDGDSMQGPAAFSVAKQPRRLLVYAPADPAR